MRNLILAVVILAALYGCSSINFGGLRSPAIEVVIEGQDRIRFSGKGSGAGMMLMTAMGPAGIAVGVAIDEGIAKEINDTYTSQYRFNQLVEAEANQWVDYYCHQESFLSLCLTEQLKLSVTHYGFKTTSGDNDPVIADIAVTFVFDQEEWVIKSNSITEIEPLEDVKKNPEASQDLLKAGLQNILNQLEEEISQ